MSKQQNSHEKLSSEQEKRMMPHREKYIDFIVNNGKYNPKDMTVDDVKADIDWLYTMAGMDTPKFIYVAKSYAEEKYMIRLIKYALANKREDLLPQQVIDQLGGDGGNKKIDWKHFRNELKENHEKTREKFADVEFNIRKAVREQVPIGMASQANKTTREEITNQMLTNIYEVAKRQTQEELLPRMVERLGQLNESDGSDYKWIEQYNGTLAHAWLCFYSFFTNEGVCKTKEFDRYFAFHMKGFWSLQFFKNWAIITQMPKRIHRDARNRLHSVDHPAVEWRDPEIKSYFLRGISFINGNEWERIVTGKMDLNDVLRERNMEKKSTILSVIGYDKIFNAVPNNMKTLLDKDYATPQTKIPGTEQYPIELWSINPQYFASGDRGRELTVNQILMLRYKCSSTGREYVDNVPEEAEVNGKKVRLDKAIKAMAWKFGMDEDTYRYGMIAES